MKKQLNIAEQWVNDVVAGRIVTGKLARMAVDRHLDDLKNYRDHGIYFSREKGQRAIDFFRFLRHFKGEHAGERFELSGWQAFVIWSLFGWYNADGTRRFNYAYCEVGKKNGKSTWAAGIALYMMIADGEAGAEVYSAATNHKQASIVFDTARQIVKMSPELLKKISVYRYNLHREETASKFEALASDSEKQDGLNPHCAIIDEYHAHRTDELINNIKSGTVSRKNPLIFMITTAGFRKESPCYYERKTCIDILNGIKQQNNKFVLIFTLDEGDNWQDSSVWIKSNPNMGISVNISKMQAEFLSAKNNEREVVNFMTKNLNIWTNASQQWIRDEDWMKCSFPFDPSTLVGKECYGGLDLASHIDINALALFFPEVEPPHNLLMFFWVPEDKVTENKDRVDYDIWKDQNFLRTTPGNVTDPKFLVHDILDINSNYKIKSIAIDPARAHHGVAQELQEHEIQLNQFRQGFISMDAPTKELEKMILGKQINHFGNPVLRWMNSNVEIKRDPAGNIKIDKSDVKRKVDGMVAAVMAIGEWMTMRAKDETDINAIYATRGLRSL
jgi:phage terminase large subunit-like protein